MTCKQQDAGSDACCTAVSPRKSTEEEVLSQVAESLMDKLAKEAYEVCMVSACIFANLVHNIATLN